MSGYLFTVLVRRISGTHNVTKPDPQIKISEYKCKLQNKKNYKCKHSHKRIHFITDRLVHTHTPSQKDSPVLFFFLFFRAQVTGSPETQGFSTYLGVLIEPADRAKMRETGAESVRERERESEGGERE